MNINKEEIEIIKELDEARKKELMSALSVELPDILDRNSGGLTLKEMKKFKENGIVNLKFKIVDDNEVPLSNDEIIFDVVVPLLEMRGVKEDDLEGIEGADYFSFYRKVDILTNNPRIQKEIEKKS